MLVTTNFPSTKDESAKEDSSPSTIAGLSPANLKASLDDALAQLDVARQQRTEVSAELFKCRCLIDELKEQKAQLQTEMSRRLATHRDDVERIQSMQKDLDRMRTSYSSKETEIIELSTRIQELMAKIESTEQHRELKEENELLWRKLDELKRSSEPAEESSSLIAEQWRARFSVLEAAISDAFSVRGGGDEEPKNEDEEDRCLAMLHSIFSAEERLRQSLNSQLSVLKAELRKSKDELQSVKDRIAQNEVAQVRIKMSEEQLAEKDLETRKLRQELDATKLDLSKVKSDLVRSQNAFSDLRKEHRALKVTAAPEKLEAEAREAQEKIQTLQDQLKSIEDEAQEQLKETQEQLRETQFQLKSSRQQLERSQAEIKSLKDQIRQPTETPSAQGLEEEVERLQRELESEREDFKDSQNEWWRVEKQLKDQIKKLENKKSPEVAKLTAELKAAKEALQKSGLEDSDQVATLKEDLASLADELASVRADLESKEAELEAKETELQAKEAELEVKRQDQTEMRESLSTKEQELEESKSQIDVLTGELEEFKSQVDALTSELEESKSKVDVLSGEVEELRVSSEELKKTSEETLKAKETEFEQRLSAMENEFQEALVGPSVSSLVADEETLTPQQQIIRLQGALSRAQVAKREVSDMVEVQKMKMGDMEKECEALKAQLVKVEEGWKAEYDAYFANLSRVTAALDKLAAEKKAADEETHSLRSKVTNLTNQITRLTKQREEPSKTPKAVAKSAAAPPPPPSSSKVNLPPSKVTLTPPLGLTPPPPHIFSIANVKIVGTVFLASWLSYLLGQLTH